MNDLPLVNILIPTYNQAEIVGKAIESSLSQDYPNLRVIVSDDCSSDNTKDVVSGCVSKSSGKLLYYRNEKNLGRVANYRKALYEHADGEWVVNLDGDDYYTDTEFISFAITRILENGADSVLFYQGSHLWVEGDRTDDFTFQMPEDEQVVQAHNYFREFYNRRFFSHMSTVYNRKAAILSGFYELDILSSDLHSILKMCVTNPDKKVIISKKRTGHWVHNNQNASKSKNVSVNLKNMKMYAEIYRAMVNSGWSRSEAARWASTATYRYIYSYLFC